MRAPTCGPEGKWFELLPQVPREPAFGLSYQLAYTWGKRERRGAGLESCQWST